MITLRHGFLLGVWLIAADAGAATFMVTTTNDSGSGSLRQAMADANGNPGADSIHFDIPGSGPHTISPATPFPDITEALTVDGYSQPGAQANTLADENDAVLKIRLHGPDGFAGTAGLRIGSSNSVVRGLAITGFYSELLWGRIAAIDVTGGFSNRVEGCFIGLNVDGTLVESYLSAGVRLGSNTARNVIGGATPAARNVIGGTGYGVWVNGSAENIVAGNFIGINPLGREPRRNLFGVRIASPSARGNLIGGLEPGRRNVISGNGWENQNSAGISIDSAVQNEVLGNFIGVDAAGRRAVSNIFAGVLITGPAASNHIGGDIPGSGNLISGNGIGVFLGSGAGSQGITIQGNLIGTDVTGTNRLGNRRHGINADSSSPLLIGGASANAGNVVSGNGADGIFINSPGFQLSTIQGNFIGTDRSGVVDLGNGLAGLWLISPSNLVGGTVPGAGNVIAFNRGPGVDYSGIILGNSIYANADLGIDLYSPGPDNNDVGDVREPQNHPQLLSVRTDTSSATVLGQLVTHSNSLCRVEFFENNECDPSGHGEGRRYLGFIEVLTGGDGRATFTYLHPSRLVPGYVVTATATRTGAGTSEFSACVEVVDLTSVDLTVGQGTDPEFVAAGSNVTFLISVYNSGPAAATSVVLTNPIPASATFVSVTSSQGACMHSGGMVTCALGTLAEGEQAEVSLTLNSPLAGRLTNVITAAASEADHSPLDNVNQFSVPIGLADLRVQLLASSDHAYVGQLFTNTIIVTNAGPDPARWVSVHLDTVPVFVPMAVNCEDCVQPCCVYFGASFLWTEIPGGASRRAEVVYRSVAIGEFPTRVEWSSSTPDPPDPFLWVTMSIEEGPGLIFFDEVNVVVREDAGVASLRLVRSGGNVGEVMVNYTVGEGTAEAASDYLLSPGTITFADGEAEKVLEVPIVADAVPECNENLFVRLLSASGGANLHFATNAMVVIVNGDSRPAGLVSPVALSYLRPGAMVDGSEAPAGSADGRYIAFTSFADDASPDYDGEQSDSGNIFVRDLQEGTTVLASPAPGQTNVGAGGSYYSSLSADGRHVLFSSYSSRLVENGPDDGAQNIYLRDLDSQTTHLVSANLHNSGGAGGYAYGGWVNTNGTVVVFPAFASNLVQQPFNLAYQQLYFRNITNQTTSLISISHDGLSGGNGSSEAGGSLTPDGRFVVFTSEASNLVTNDTNYYSDVFLRDLVTQTTTLVSADQTGHAGGGWLPLVKSHFVSSHGRYVVFSSWATNLAANSPSGEQAKVYLRDMAAGVTRLASILPDSLPYQYRDCYAAQLTPDGRFVAFVAERLEVWEGLGGGYDIFVRDLIAETTTLVTVNCQGTAPANGFPYSLQISDDGRYVTFEHTATDLVPGEWPRWLQNHLYRRDLVTGTTTLLSQNHSFTGPANEGVEGTWTSADGKVVAFGSGASDLVPGDDSDFDVFVWREGLTPQLSISIVDGVVTLNWLAALDGFQLEFASGLESAPVWESFDGQISQSGAFKTVSFSSDELLPARFFRLRQP